MLRKFLLGIMALLTFSGLQAQSDTVKAFINQTLNYSMPLLNTFEMYFSTRELSLEQPYGSKSERNKSASIPELKASLVDSVEDAITYSALGTAFDAKYQIDSAKYYHAKAVLLADRLLLKYPDSVSYLSFMVFSGLYLNEVNLANRWMERFKVTPETEPDYLLLRYLVCGYTGCGFELRDEIRLKYKSDTSNQSYIYLLSMFDFQLEAINSFINTDKEFRSVEQVLPMKELRNLPSKKESEFDYAIFSLGYYSIYHITRFLNVADDSLAKSSFLKETEATRNKVLKLLKDRDFHNEVTAYFHLGTSYMSEMEFRKAVKFLKKSIKETPGNIGNGMLYNNEKAYNNLFSAYLMMGDTSKAISLLIQKTKDKPAGLLEVDDYIDLATLHYTLGDNEKANEYLNLSFELTEQKPEAWLLKAAVDRKLKGTKEGLKALEKAYELNKEKEEVYLMLSMFYAELGDRRTAKGFAEVVYNVRPQNSLATNLVALMYLW